MVLGPLLASGVRPAVRLGPPRTRTPLLCTEQLVPDEELVASVMRDLPLDWSESLQQRRARAEKIALEKMRVDVDANYDECVTESPPPLSDEAVECLEERGAIPTAAADDDESPADEASPSPPPRQRRGVYGAPPAAPPPPPPNLLGEEAALRQAIEEIAESYRDGGGGDGDPVELPSEALSDTVRDAEKVRYEVRSFVEGVRADLERLQGRAIEKLRVDATTSLRIADFLLRRALLDTTRALTGAVSAVAGALPGAAPPTEAEDDDEAAAAKDSPTPFSERLDAIQKTRAKSGADESQLLALGAATTDDAAAKRAEAARRFARDEETKEEAALLLGEAWSAAAKRADGWLQARACPRSPTATLPRRRPLPPHRAPDGRAAGVHRGRLRPTGARRRLGGGDGRACQEGGRRLG